jgi:hypothetical protein
MSDATAYRIAFFDRFWDNHAKLADLTWPQLIDRLSHRWTGTDKRQGPSWSPAIYQEGVNHFVEVERGPEGERERSWDAEAKSGEIQRLKVNSHGWSLLVFDLEDAGDRHLAIEDLDALIAELTARGLAYILYSTHSHLPPDKVRARLVLAPDHAILPDEIHRAVLGGIVEFGLCADASCKDPGRLFGLPAGKPGTTEASTIFRHADGLTVDVAAILRKAPVAPVRPSKAQVIRSGPALARYQDAAAAFIADNPIDVGRSGGPCPAQGCPGTDSCKALRDTGKASCFNAHHPASCGTLCQGARIFDALDLAAHNSSRSPKAQLEALGYLSTGAIQMARSEEPPPPGDADLAGVPFRATVYRREDPPPPSDADAPPMAPVRQREPDPIVGQILDARIPVLARVRAALEGISPASSTDAKRIPVVKALELLDADGDTLDREEGRKIIRAATGIGLRALDEFAGEHAVKAAPPSTLVIVTQGHGYAGTCEVVNSPEFITHACEGQALEYNAMAARAELGREPFEDHRVNRCRQLIPLYYGFKKLKDGEEIVIPYEPNKDDFWGALEQMAHTRPYHPVQEYLQGLAWDHVGRIAMVPSDILGIASPSEIECCMVRKFFIGAVARALEPGCKLDTVLIFQGAQGSAKTSFFEHLAGRPEWYLSFQGDYSSRDSQQMLSAAWIVEFGELEGIHGREITAFKDWSSRRTDQWVGKWQRAPTIVPRTFVVVGTTNEETFLSDATGNRRFWPLATGHIEIDKLDAWRDQLWAEALAAYQSGEQWWLDSEREIALNSAQERFEPCDAWQDLIVAWLEKPERDGTLTVARVLSDAILKVPGQWTKGDEMRVSAVLKRLGYQGRRMAIDGHRKYVYSK